MRRTLATEALPSALQVSAPDATRVALEAPPTGPAALADDADVTLDAVTGAGEAACVAGEAGGTSARTLTVAAGLPLSWSELDEWLEAS
ncbi:MAG: hypothetical protein U1F45_01335 [Burkholderiales bacterium]